MQEAQPFVAGVGDVVALDGLEVFLKLLVLLHAEPVPKEVNDLFREKGDSLFEFVVLENVKKLRPDLLFKRLHETSASWNHLLLKHNSMRIHHQEHSHMGALITNQVFGQLESL